MKQTLILILLLAGEVAFSQSTTFRNNYGTNYINGQTGNFVKSSFTWTITQNGNAFNIKTSAMPESFNVSFASFDSNNKLFKYNVVGSGIFDGSRVNIVLSTSKLEDYANGIVKEVNLLAIVFADNTGYIYKLNK